MLEKNVHMLPRSWNRVDTVILQDFHYYVRTTIKSLDAVFLTIDAIDNRWNDKLSKAKSIREGTVQMQLR